MAMRQPISAPGPGCSERAEEEDVDVVGVGAAAEDAHEVLQSAEVWEMRSITIAAVQVKWLPPQAVPSVGS